jgi:hypothetical protein
LVFIVQGSAISLPLKLSTDRRAPSAALIAMSMAMPALS